MTLNRQRPDSAFRPLPTPTPRAGDSALPTPVPPAGRERGRLACALLLLGSLDGCAPTPKVESADAASPSRSASHPGEAAEGGVAGASPGTTTSDPTDPTDQTDPADSATTTASAKPPPGNGGVPVDCGPHECRRFDTAAEALSNLMARKRPKVIGFGEAHAPADFEAPTTVARFTEQLLPELAPSSSYLMVEILAPPAAGCQKETDEARRESETITQGQNQNNQNEYVALGLRSRELSVVPDILRASCEQIRTIASPEGGVLAYMETIAELFAESVAERLERTEPQRPLVLAYGGALHNDALPRPGRESWSYAEELIQLTEGGYQEVDLIVPELIRDTEAWRGFAWYEAYQELETKGGVLLMEWGPQSAALFFAPTND